MCEKFVNLLFAMHRIKLWESHFILVCTYCCRKKWHGAGSLLPHNLLPCHLCLLAPAVISLSPQLPVAYSVRWLWRGACSGFGSGIRPGASGAPLLNGGEEREDGGEVTLSWMRVNTVILSIATVTDKCPLFPSCCFPSKQTQSCVSSYFPS